MSTTVPPSKTSVPRTAARWFYFFGHGDAEGDGARKDLLGGKGAGLADMSRAGIPVPPGFTITTEACRWYYANGRTLPAGFEDGQKHMLARLEDAFGKRPGDPMDPM